MGQHLCGAKREQRSVNLSKWSHHQLNGLQTCYDSEKHKEGKCQFKCRMTCLHGKRCDNKCGEPCRIQCQETCRNRCKHQACRRTCDRICSVKVCQERCEENCPLCGHKCMGVCGEACPPCPCKAPFKCPISLEWIDSTSEKRIYQLPECSCRFELKAIDDFVQSQIEIGDGRLLRCPRCKHPICTSLRYANQVRTLFSASRMNPTTTMTMEERLPILRVVEKEAAMEKGSLKGNWYQCENGHPYFVGNCGVPRESGVCVDCKKRIGGDRERLILFQQHQV